MSGKWIATGPWGGSVQLVLVDEKKPSTVFTATRSGLLFRSDDSGTTWIALPLPRHEGATPYTMALAGANPEVLYVGMVVNTDNTAASQIPGIYKSVDFGVSWMPLIATEGTSVYGLAVSTIHPNVVVASTSDGILKSVNDGGLWTRLSPSDNDDLRQSVSILLDPKDDNVMFVGTTHLPWKTVDGGKTWTSIHAGMVDDSDVFSLVSSTLSKQRVYAGACSGIYVSDNGGSLWRKVLTIPSESSRTHAVIEAPDPMHTLYAGTTNGLWRSVTQGRTWERVSKHIVNSMALDASSNTLFLATDDAGIVRSSDKGESFYEGQTGFVNRRTTRSLWRQHGMCDDEDGELYISTVYDGRSGGVFRRKQVSGPWENVVRHERLLDENIIALAAGNRVPCALWAASYDSVFLSPDRGVTWSRVAGATVSGRPRSGEQLIGALSKVAAPFPMSGQRMYDLRVLNDDSATLLAATSEGLWASRDHGLRWSRVANGLPVGGAVYAVYSSDESDRVLAAPGSVGLYLSLDGGATWRRSASNVVAGSVNDMQGSAVFPSKIWLATTGGLLQSVDSGLTWKLRMDGLGTGEVTALARDPRKPRHVLCAQIGRLYESNDDGNTWQKVDSSGLEGNRIIAVIPWGSGLDGMVAVGSQRGVFSYAGNAVASGVTGSVHAAADQVKAMSEARRR